VKKDQHWKNLKKMKASDYLNLLLLSTLIISCESGNYRYEKLIYDMPNKTFALEKNSNFVIDSIEMSYSGNTIYSIKLMENGKGKKQININDTNDSYFVYVNNLQKICNDELKETFQGLTIWVRHKNYHHKNLYLDRDSIQKFSFNKLPCDTLKIQLEAFKRR